MVTKEHIVYKKDKQPDQKKGGAQFDFGLAERIMKENDEASCLVVKGVTKQNKTIVRDDIKAFMQKHRLSTFFYMEMHKVPYYFVTLE